MTFSFIDPETMSSPDFGFNPYSGTKSKAGVVEPITGAKDVLNFNTSKYLPKSTPWYKNSDMLSSGAGLASALTQVLALPSQIELAETQTDALKQNLKVAKQEQKRRNTNISGFNSFSSAPKSAFVP